MNSKEVMKNFKAWLKNTIDDSNIEDKELANKICSLTLENLEKNKDNPEYGLDYNNLPQEMSIGIINDQSDFINTVFNWQANVNANTFREYSHHLNVVAEVLDLIDNL